MSSKTEQNSTIDFMRGIAIIMIFFVHYGQSFSGGFDWTRFGQMGSQIFIFLSGYTSCLSFHRSKSGIHFYKKRLLSITPGFYTALVVIVIANFLSEEMYGKSFVGTGNTSAVAVLCNFLLIHGVLRFCNNSVYPGGWFVGTLVILYLLHPIIDRFYASRRNKLLHILAVVLSMGLMTVGINYLQYSKIYVQNNSFTYFLFTNQLPCYLLGIDLYYRERKKGEAKPKSKHWMWMVIIMLLVSVFVFYCDYTYSFVIVPTLVGGLTYWLYIYLQSISFRISKQVIVKRICTMGADSFFIYLTHTTVVWTFVGIMKKVINRVVVFDQPFLFIVLIFPSVLISRMLALLLKRVVQAEEKVLHLRSLL